MTDPAPTDHTASRFIGLILLSIGVLWLVLTGLCAVGALVMTASQGDFTDMLMISAFSVPSALNGAAFYFGGRFLRPKR